MSLLPSPAVKDNKNVLVSRPSLSNQDRELLAITSPCSCGDVKTRSRCANSRTDVNTDSSCGVLRAAHAPRMPCVLDDEKTSVQCRKAPDVIWFFMEVKVLVLDPRSCATLPTTYTITMILIRFMTFLQRQITFFERWYTYRAGRKVQN